jgi:signal transduction histidine kinase
MNVSTRLILLLTLTVNAVMATASYLTLRHSERGLEQAARDEVRAHALTMRIALEEDYLTGRTIDAQRLVNRMGENAGVFGAILFNESGQVLVASSNLAAQEIRYEKEAQQVIATGQIAEVLRNISGMDVYSVILPLKTGSDRVGAIEVAQQISFIKEDMRRLRTDMGITTLILCATIFLAVWLVTRLSLSRRISELLAGASALGEGKLEYRVAAPASGGEFTLLASEFNRMADKLAEQRVAFEREAEARIEMERRLRHSERLAAVGRLAAGVAHEIGAPLQVIDGRAKQLLNNPEAPLETRQRNLTIIRTQSERIARLIRRLLNLARPHNLRLEKVDLPQLVKEIAESLETAAAHNNVKIEVVSNGEVTVQADRDLLHQAILNICANGIQAMPAGGNLKIDCLADFNGRDGRAFSALRVSDTGEGIAAENLARIFEPFFTTKEDGSGNGLGLAVASRIVAEHGGWIEAANGEGGGAVFTIYLPKTEIREKTR